MPLPTKLAEISNLVLEIIGYLMSSQSFRNKCVCCCRPKNFTTGLNRSGVMEEFSFQRMEKMNHVLLVMAACTLSMELAGFARQMSSLMDRPLVNSARDPLLPKHLSRIRIGTTFLLMLISHRVVCLCGNQVNYY